MNDFLSNFLLDHDVCTGIETLSKTLTSLHFLICVDVCCIVGMCICGHAEVGGQLMVVSCLLVLGIEHGVLGTR